ncbi:MAG: 3'-5' exonuclease [Thermoflavifilum sp.]|nr:3'-5' exonuclease [Thermoflavifilum sp.]
MPLQLKRPLAFLDLETTGVNLANDRIVEIAIVKIFPDGQQKNKVKRVNPGIPIPPEATAIHGITDKDVANCPTFKDVANEIKQFLDNCDLAGYNLHRFDIPMLVEEFLRADQEFSLKDRHIIDVQKIFFRMEPRDLSAAYRFYCGKEFPQAHHAEADAWATYEVLQAQLNKYPELQACQDLACLAEFTSEGDFVDVGRRMIRINGVEVFNFGKHKGKPVREVLRDEPQYYDWIKNGEFLLDTKNKLDEIWNSMLKEKLNRSGKT